VAIHGDKIRLGFAAPESVTIDREEIHQRRGGLVPEAIPVHGLSGPARRAGALTQPRSPGRQLFGGNRPPAAYDVLGFPDARR
jgi:hypothetical protein